MYYIYDFSTVNILFQVLEIILARYYIFFNSEYFLIDKKSTIFLALEYISIFLIEAIFFQKLIKEKIRCHKYIYQYLFNDFLFHFDLSLKLEYI